VKGRTPELVDIFFIFQVVIMSLRQAAHCFPLLQQVLLQPSAPTAHLGSFASRSMAAASSAAPPVAAPHGSEQAPALRGNNAEFVVSKLDTVREWVHEHVRVHACVHPTHACAQPVLCSAASWARYMPGRGRGHAHSVPASPWSAA